MDKNKYLIIRLFFVLFTVSVSVAILPCGIINVYGLFGEVTTYTVTEDKEQEIVNIKAKEYEKVQTEKGVNTFNFWFEILMVVVCISFFANAANHPREDTIVTLKVRIDD